MARKLNSLFGEIEIENRANKNKYGTSKFDFELNENVPDVIDFVTRSSGIGKKKIALGRALTALADPEIYLQDKYYDLTDINRKLTLSFVKKYKKKLKEGYYDEEARKLAWKEVKQKQAELMDDHRRLYPTQIKGEGDIIKLVQPKDKNPIF